MSTIAVVGSINADLMVSVERHPAPGETVPGSGGTICPGGKGANQALAAALMGGNVAMVGAVGDDENAHLALHYLKDAGVNLDHVATRGDVTGLAIVAVDSQGENNIIVIPGANGEVDRALLADASDVIGGADVVVVQGEIPVGSIAEAAQMTTGRLVVNLAPVVKVAPEVLLKADPLVVNEYEGELALELLREAGLTDGEAGESLEFTELAEALLAAGVPSVVMTIGARGAIIATSDGTSVVPSPEVKVVDTTGAGDAFVGGLATRLAVGDSIEQAVQFAVRVGAAACTGAGAQPSYPHSPTGLPATRNQQK
ncbi:ribokinase [Trueperella pyogenes]|uniref:ribokinase n=1 Tax=Trueperella pyogenes TaxID=1661 RepID=UPI000C1B6B41|nr:ribokinase [Trueperella pyogenes]PIN51243.1 ribokinase [Trueperella pyogenes]